MLSWFKRLSNPEEKLPELSEWNRKGTAACLARDRGHVEIAEILARQTN